MNEKVFSKYDIMTVGKCHQHRSITALSTRIQSEEELNMTFSFHHLKVIIQMVINGRKRILTFMP